MALSISHNTRLFGLDLSQWPSQWRAAGALLLDFPGLRWLTPPVRVELLGANGGRSTWDVLHGVAMIAAPRGTERALPAVELASCSVLDRQFTLPRLGPADLTRAVQLEVDTATPFEPAQTVFGYIATPLSSDTLHINLALASRAHVESQLQSAPGGGASFATQPEAWVLPAGARSNGFTPLVIRGFGEERRQQLAARGRYLRLALLALALLLLAAIALTPTLQIRVRAMQAESAFAALKAQVAPQAKLRESMTQHGERLNRVGQLAAQQLAWLPVLNMLTRAVPDGAWLTAVNAEGTKVVIHGNADDAAALVQRLASEAGVRDVRLLSPATLGRGAVKEVFAIEMTLDPKRYAIAWPRGTS